MSLENTNCKYFNGKEQDKKYPVYCKYYEVKERINPNCVLCSDNTSNQSKQNNELTKIRK